MPEASIDQAPPTSTEPTTVAAPTPETQPVDHIQSQLDSWLKGQNQEPLGLVRAASEASVDIAHLEELWKKGEKYINSSDLIRRGETSFLGAKTVGGQVVVYFGIQDPDGGRYVIPVAPDLIPDAVLEEPKKR